MSRPPSFIKLQEREQHAQAELKRTRKALQAIQAKRRAEAKRLRRKEERRLGAIAYACGLQVYDSETLSKVFMALASPALVSGVPVGLQTFLERETR